MENVCQRERRLADLTGRESGDRRSPRSAAVSGGRWSVGGALTSQIVGVASTAVLARLLAPSDFGLVAGARTVTALLALFAGGALSSSIIQRRSVNREETTALFWAMLGMGAVVGGIGVFSAPWLAGVFGIDNISPLLAAVAATFPLVTTEGLFQATLVREFRFGSVTLVDVGAQTLKVAIAIGLAATTSLGAWTIIIGQIVSQVLRTCAKALLSPFRPTMTFRWQSLRPHVTFNMGVLGSRVVTYAAKNADYWYLGRMSATKTLGAYYIAYSVPSLIRRRVTATSSSVMFPVLARMQSDKKSLARAYLDLIELSAFVAWPATVGLALVARPFVQVIYGIAWLPAAAPLAILSLAAAVDSFSYAGLALLAVGRSALALLVSLFRFTAIIVSLAVVYPSDDVQWIAIAVFAGSVVALVSGILIVAGTISIRIADFLQAGSTAAIPTTFMAVSVLILQGLLDLPPHLALLGSIAVGIASYLFAGFIFVRRRFQVCLSRSLRLVGLNTSQLPREPE